MLRTNLSTRPFYNERAVRLGLGVAAVLVAALTTFNVLQVLSLNARNGEMAARIRTAQEQTTQVRQQARAMTSGVNTAEIGAVQTAAREANLLITRRAFSWTELFNRFESTLPGDVRITAVEPQIDREGRLLVAASVVSRRVEDLHEFMDQLESTGGFREVISRQDIVLEDGLLQSIVQGYYDPATSAMGTAAPAAPQNASPETPAAPAAPAPQGGVR